MQGISDILSRLDIGDVFRAQILDYSVNEVLLKLFDGTTLKASSMASIDAKRGDFLDFVVKNIIEKQLFVETVKNTSAKLNDGDTDIKKQLASLDLKADSLNMEIGKGIGSNKLPFNKQIFDTIASMVTEFRQLSPSKAAFLVSKNLVPDEKSIELLNHFVEGKLKIGTQLDELSQVLKDIGDDNLVDNLLRGLISENQGNKESIKEPVNINTVVQIDMEAVDESLEPKLFNALKNITVDLEDMSLQSNDIDKLSNILKNTIVMDKELSLNDKNNLLEHIRRELAIPENKALVKEDAQKLVNNIVSRYKSAEKDSDEFIKTPDNEKRELLQKATDRLFVKIDSSTRKEELNIKNIYRDISNKLDIIKENIINSTLPNREEIVARIENLESNIRFQSSISNHSTYVQIPLSIMNKNTTGELYLLKKDPKRRKLDPENLTMLISLNTINIGQIDSLISFNRKNISLNIRVEDKRLFDIIKEGHMELYKSLLDKGFKLVDLKYRLTDEAINISNAEVIARKEFDTGKLSFDYRV